MMRIKLILGIGVVLLALSGVGWWLGETVSGERLWTKVLSLISLPPVAEKVDIPSPLPRKTPAENDPVVEGVRTEERPVKKNSVPSQIPLIIPSTPQLAPAVPKRTNLSDDERQVLNFINRLVGKFNQLLPGVNMQSLSDCIASAELAIHNIETCRLIANNGTGLMEALKSERDEMIKSGPFTITHPDYLGQKLVNQSIYAHSQEFATYIGRGAILFEAADEYLKILDTELYQKNRDSLSSEETSQIQDQQAELERAQKVAVEALKIFSELKLKL